MTRFLHEFRIGSDKEQRDADLGRILSEHALAPFTERDVTTTDASNPFDAAGTLFRCKPFDSS